MDGYNGVRGLAHADGARKRPEDIFGIKVFLGLAYNIDEITVFYSQLKDEYTETIYSFNWDLDIDSITR